MSWRPRMVALLIPRDDRRAHAQERSARNTLRPRTGLVAVSPVSPPIRTNFGRILPVKRPGDADTSRGTTQQETRS